MTDATEDLENVLGVLIRLSSGDYSARGIPSESREEFAALMLGVNMLAEELEASSTELEQRVLARTSQLERLNRDVLALSELGNRLQSCASVHEALEVTTQGVRAMFATASGALYVRSPNLPTLMLLTAWGPLAPTETVVDATGCRALHQSSSPQPQPVATVADCVHAADEGAAEATSLCVPLVADGQLFGLLRLREVASEPEASRLSTPASERLVTAAVEHAALALANLELRAELRAQAMRDPLTGLYNRRFTDEWVPGELSRSDRAGTSMGVILVDIDWFKKVNDEHGHDAGDEVLHAVAAVLRDSVRPEDVACRYGGDEFLLLLGGIDQNSLATRADKLRARVSRLRLQHGGVPLPPVTVSAGFALYPQHGDTFPRVLAAADAALYRAKHAGRNRVQPAGP